MNLTVRHCISRRAILLVALCGTLFVSCRTGQKGPAASTIEGQILYTQFALFHENQVHRTTNYRKGILVPVNTEVTFLKANKTEIVVQLSDGRDLTIVNIQDYSGESIDGIFLRTFAKNTVDLSAFTEPERQGIATGKAKTGMRKAAVIVAMGHPPKHKTPSLQGDQWRYWQSRFNTVLVHFEDDKVSRIQE